MSQAGVITGGGGGGGTEDFVTNNGTATQVGGSINILGQAAGTVPVMFTNGAVDTVSIENRAWETQYVVDPSATVGLRGTFQTIQAAINQAVSDGMLLNNPKKIYIRTGLYTENLSIPPGTILVGETFAYPYGGVVNASATTISGVHTFSGSAVVGFNNLQFIQAGGTDDMFTGGDAVLAYFDNCGITSTSTGSIVNATSASSHYSFSRCQFSGTGNQVYFETLDSNNELFLINCLFQQSMDFAWDGFIDLTDTNNIGQITTSGFVTATRCFFSGGTGTAYIDGTGECILYQCIFSGADPAIASTITINNMVYCGTNSTDERLYDTPVTYNVGVCQQGNLIKSVTTATNYDLDANDYYVGVTSTAAARTINLPPIADVNQDQIYIIKDQSGGAGTNNITVTTVAGVALIDGTASQPINVNYGSMTVKFDGTNYWII